MSQSFPDAPAESGRGVDAFVELRSLLIGPEEAEIRGLKERLDDPSRFAVEVANVLAPALRHSAAQGQQLEEALGPSVEKAVRSLARDDPGTFTEVICPLIGPALRKSIAGLLRRVWPVFLIGAIGAGVWCGLTLQSRWRWRGYLETLARQPGVIVTGARRTSLRGGVVRGLRDPLAADLSPFGEQAGLDVGRISASWLPYHSLEPAMVLSRARQILDPPDGIELELVDSRLVVAGVASRDWLAATQTLARAIPGIREVQIRADADDSAQRAFAAAAAAIAGRRLHFDAASTEPRESLTAIASELIAIERLADELGKSIEMKLVGRTDTSGESIANVALSLQRARAVHDGFRAAGVTLSMDIDGRGSFDPVPVVGPVDRLDDENRSVTLQLRSNG